MGPLNAFCFAFILFFDLKTMKKSSVRFRKFWLSLLLIGLTVPMIAESSPNDIPLNQMAISPEPKNARSSFYWHDGKRERKLELSQKWIANFNAPGKSPLQSINPIATTKTRIPNHPSEGLGKFDENGKSQWISPVFIDESGQLLALPGGIIVQLSNALDAPKKLIDAGLKPIRRLAGKQNLWLVKSPPGQPTLELVHRLRESHQFESVQPNWWRLRPSR